MFQQNPDADTDEVIRESAGEERSADGPEGSGAGSSEGALMNDDLTLLPERHSAKTQKVEKVDKKSGETGRQFDDAHDSLGSESSGSVIIDKDDSRKGSSLDHEASEGKQKVEKMTGTLSEVACVIGNTQKINNTDSSDDVIIVEGIDRRRGKDESEDEQEVEEVARKLNDERKSVSLRKQIHGVRSLRSSADCHPNGYRTESSDGEGYEAEQTGEVQKNGTSTECSPLVRHLRRTTRSSALGRIDGESAKASSHVSQSEVS